MNNYFNDQQYENILSALEGVPEAGPLDQGCFVVGDNNESVVVGDELSYLQLIKTLLQILATKATRQGEAVYTSEVEGRIVKVSNEVGGILNAYGSQINLTTMYVCATADVATVAETLSR